MSDKCCYRSAQSKRRVLLLIVLGAASRAEQGVSEGSTRMQLTRRAGWSGKRRAAGGTTATTDMVTVTVEVRVERRKFQGAQV